MSYINLIDKIPSIEKEAMENYISRYGTSHSFVGLDKWLQNWSHSKQTLYHLLGDSLIKEFPYSYEKQQSELEEQIEHWLPRTVFKYSYHTFFETIIYPACEANKMSIETKRAFSRLSDVCNFVDNKIHQGLKYKREDKKNTLQLQPGMKPMRAFSKVIEYFSDIYKFENFEDFKTEYSMILNDKIIKGTVCISIHPFDFITMSDNASKWSSCMSWKDDGCYHQGTVEMMNSNNVLCCYLKSKEPYHFDEVNGVADPEWTWNNKKWRVLCYATKDIIMCGKSYPYKNDALVKEILDYIRTLAKENLGWKYSFGPELYKDMIHINNNNQMEKNRTWIRTKYTTKHNILFDTKGMYNDMLNDHYTKYWCYRNKVNHNKIISVSGKSVCLCCCKPVIEINYDCEWEDDYNERFVGAGDSVCGSCIKDFACDCCQLTGSRHKYYVVNIQDNIYNLCQRCFDKRVKKCPCCGKPFLIKDTYENGVGFIDLMPNRDVLSNIYRIEDYYYYDTPDKFTLFEVYVCPACKKREKSIFTKQNQPYTTKWGDRKVLSIITGESNPEKYSLFNLEDVENKNSLIMNY